MSDASRPHQQRERRSSDGFIGDASGGFEDSSPISACPACGDPEVVVTDGILASELVALYRDRGIDVSPYFRGVPIVFRCHCETCDLGFFSPPCAGDGFFYEQLQHFDWYYQDTKPEYDYARAYVAEGERVLEVGCGKGAFRAFLPDSVDYAGLEFNDEAVGRANAAGLNVMKQPVEAHAAAHPQSYDVVCAFQVLEHVPDPAGFVHACVEALAPNGRLLLAVPSEDSFLALAANAPLNLPPHHVLRWTDRALANLARREQLVVLDLWHEPVAPFHESWYLQTLAHHYFALHGMAKPRLIDRSLSYRLIGRLLRHARLRDSLAHRTLDRRPELRHGHTVVLAARRPGTHQ